MMSVIIGISNDGMHGIGGVVHDLFRLVLGLRESTKAMEHENDVNERWRGGQKPWLFGKGARAGRGWPAC